MHNFATLGAYVAGRKRESLLVAFVGGVLVGGYFIVRPIYYTSDYAANKRAQQSQVLPEKGKATNKYGQPCLYMAFSTDYGAKFYTIEAKDVSPEYKYEQNYCTEEQAKSAGYSLYR